MCSVPPCCGSRFRCAARSWRGCGVSSASVRDVRLTPNTPWQSGTRVGVKARQTNRHEMRPKAGSPGRGREERGFWVGVRRDGVQAQFDEEGTLRGSGGDGGGGSGGGGGGPAERAGRRRRRGETSSSSSSEEDTSDSSDDRHVVPVVLPTNRAEKRGPHPRQRRRRQGVGRQGGGWREFKKNQTHGTRNCATSSSKPASDPITGRCTPHARYWCRGCCRKRARGLRPGLATGARQLRGEIGAQSPPPSGW